jgi:hypothetical protein
MGYNCSLFAYGQTGSGKSFSVVGYGANKGIVPVFCEELFTEINNKKESEVEYQVSFSMLEIYNEKASDYSQCVAYRFKVQPAWKWMDHYKPINNYV